MAHRDVVVVGASAGGVEALRDFVSGLPADLPAAVLVVLHMPGGGRSALASVLTRPSSLPVRAAIEGAPLVPGTVTVGVPDRHLLLTEDERLTLSLGPRENGHRPSVDALFRSAAQVAGPRVIGVVLSGALDDGASGMLAIASRGGAAVVQDPTEALYDSMPRTARGAVGAAHVLPAAEIGPLLGRLTREDLGDDVQVAPAPLDMRMENAMAHLDGESWGAESHPGDPVPLTCPDCHGPLFRIPDGVLHRFRCLVGHAWSAESLAAQHTSAVEGALWMALRTLEEKAELSRAMAARASAAGHELTGRTFEERADDAHQAAVLVRDLLERATRDTPVVPEDGVA
ncbi:chemotaxis protein CheB [Petropleomorpha daqingensis]|uniref:protein-glutamate methylesterase n=1 Tax=Petropleomorpha daqingensis TaxID=2026353 RepID=A0A853CFV2_9ACTN|nr:two-component system chemotaxis response regulator CheB [Petropleomorpha daqingensis]